MGREFSVTKWFAKIKMPFLADFTANFVLGMPSCPTWGKWCAWDGEGRRIFPWDLGQILLAVWPILWLDETYRVFPKIGKLNWIWNERAPWLMSEKSPQRFGRYTEIKCSVWNTRLVFLGYEEEYNSSIVQPGRPARGRPRRTPNWILFPPVKGGGF